MRGPWLADFESALRDAALGGWWAGLPATIDGRGAAALGRLVEASRRRPTSRGRYARRSRASSSVTSVPGECARVNGAVARLAVH